MISKKNIFRTGSSFVAIVCLLNIISCNPGSKDTIPAVNDNSMSTEKSGSPTSAPAPKMDSAAANMNTNTADSNPASAHVVTIENMKFNPATITVKKGDQVTFTNKDVVAHNATEIHNAWASPMLQTGQSWTFTPEKTSDYYCTVHLVMKGKIIVK
ncbi:cupredoxin family copper-binding protein [Chryseobacterium sp. MDT2-18]|uniref:cupredoxin domain-containing protein n=1 Tax=Chryseobacterium sp. MDT2-18 TaxID=1259136 RepID=UPI002787832C|nr:cupredoxin family copper-binding protein [Chryseobacterium sp. MDT2-18]MDQ0475585.1 plastocyanin [Chryseobacterium sp. MDT2-18]